jgi:hypothetical protein
MDSVADLNTLIYQLRSDIVMEDFDDGALLLRLSDRHLIEINPVGQRILGLTDGKSNTKQVVSFLVKQFDISAVEALQDTLAFYDDLYGQGVLEKVFWDAYKENYTMQQEVTNIAGRYLRNPDVVLREEDEYGGLLFNPDTNQIKVVNQTGLFIWQNCDGQMALDEIVKALQDAFDDIPVDAVNQDVQEFLQVMRESGFVGIVD